MKESKAIYVTKHKIRDDQNFVYQLYTQNREYWDRYGSNNFGCQYDSKKDNACTCRNMLTKRQDIRYFSGVPKQIYAYHGSRSFTDIGVGSVKALQRRKVKRVYLPETDDRGVGSSDLSSFISRKNKLPKGSYYDHKRTSSKCIGGFVECNSLISQKLSPIVQTRSGSTSPKIPIDLRNIEIGSNTVGKNFVTTGTQFEIEKKESEAREEMVKTDKGTESPKKTVVKISEQTHKYKYSAEMQGNKTSITGKKVKDADKVYSSDSLVQHVHNLESPSDEKRSRASIDPMENKLEREYRRMFSPKDRDSKVSIDKPLPVFKSTSLLKRRFEALRRGSKKDDGKKNAMPSSQDSVPSRKDVSVTSDPPSLEGRSFTDTKRYSPIQTNEEQIKNKTSYKEEKNSLHCPPSYIDSECQGVKGMFNLWGKKFKFEDEAEKSKPMPPLAIDINKRPHKEVKSKKETERKKSGRKFFFFKKKSKDQKINKPMEKEKETYSPSGVTAGRCEIKEGLILKMGGFTSPKEKGSKISEVGEEIQRKNCLKNFMANSITSAKSINVRWNNSMYATSSSTVFELMDTIYKNNDLILKSRSEITSEESYYRSYTKNRVNFDQNIEAWMIPKTITNRPKEIPVRIQSNRVIKKRDIDVTISDQRWFIEKSKAFANKIEVVLHSKNFNTGAREISSEYLRIDVPKNFFDISSSDSKENHTSDEEVYKIVEYESVLNTNKALDKGDHAPEIKVIVSFQDSKNLEAKILETVIKRPPMHRDVVIQGSNVNIPKRCDVIGVGIITQRDIRDIRKPILKIQDVLTDDDSEEDIQINQKKCEFAESYLQDYYRHWTPLGIDLFSWCVSDSHLRSCSEKSLISYHNQGDGSKSCPNICEEFQTSTIVSSCDTSSCSQCCEEVQKPENFSSKFFKKFKRPSKAKTDSDIAGTRVLPKDSLEVFKRRKIYAASRKSQWACCDDMPVSVPSIESKGAQNTGCPKMERPICKTNRPRAVKKVCKKHVSMLDCDTLNEMLADQLCCKKIEGILAFKGQSGCDACKRRGSKCAKHAVVKSKPVCEIPQPPCKAACEKMKKPPCENLSPNRSPQSGCNKSPSPPPTQPRTRRRATPHIVRKPTCSPPKSPAGSHNCLSPAESYHAPPQKSEKICPKCQHKLPCLKFPNCLLSPSESFQICPKCSPAGSSGGSTKKSPPGSPGMTLRSKGTGPKKIKPLKCPVPKFFDPNKKKKRQLKSPCDNDKYPWPMDSQTSNPTSPSCSETNQKEEIEQCDSNCSLLSKTSNQLCPPKINKECKPDCANRKKNQQPKPQMCPENLKQPCPSQQQQPCPAKPQNAVPQSCTEISKNKKSGLFLKMKPSKKCSKECIVRENKGGVVKLNSREQITISMKQDTPSTQEIRKCMNIKVQDDDGNTLFERKDYTCGQSGHKLSVLGDVYNKHSKINRVSTPVMVVTNEATTIDQKQQDDADDKSDASLANIMEIQFNLRIIQGNKTTEISIANNNEEKEDEACEVSKTVPQIFVVENDAEDPIKPTEEGPKNDINIKIVVKNYKPKSNKMKDTKKYDDEYSNNITNKFHTVSTGYSDVITDPDTDNVFSMHRTTIDLESLEETTKTLTKPSNELTNEELTETFNFMVPSHSTEHVTNDVTEDENIDKTTSRKKDQSYDKYDYANEDTKDLDSDQDATLDLNTSNEYSDIKYNAKEEKKELLKRVFEKAYSTPKNKENVRQLRDSLKIILTDSSDNDEINAVNKELAKDVTYTSLKPEYFRNTDSMNNYYKMESSLTVQSKVTSNIQYPTSENNSNASYTSKTIKPMGCMCSRVAEKLNCDLKNGCCCKPRNIDEKISCDIRNEQDSLNYRNYVDVETQNSKHLTGESNSTNLSVQDNCSAQIETDCISQQGNATNTIKNSKVVNRVTKAFSPHESHVKQCEMKKLNRTTTLGISDDDKIVLLSEDKTERNTSRIDQKAIKYDLKVFTAADVLQCYETKKAVLEIYAEKTTSQNEEHFIAKLPKFVYEKESEITKNYEKIATNSYKSVCRKDVIRMSVGD